MSGSEHARRELIRRIHESDAAGVFAVTGGGSLLLSDLLTEPGASATVLEARVPYHAAALAEFIGAPPEQAVSEETACNLAMASFERALLLGGERSNKVFGLGVTASLATKTRKRGAHRVHVAVQTRTQSRLHSLVLDKDLRTREEEEHICRDLALDALAGTLDLDPRPALDLRSSEQIDTICQLAPDAWQAVLMGDALAAPHPDSGAFPRALLPGAFNPLHPGHRAMAAHASRQIGATVAFELCARNVDKPPLHYLAIARRLARFAPEETVWLTRLPTFIEKARHFPGVTFVVGVDTLARVADVRYYGDDPQARDQAIAEMRELGVGFLVYGRERSGRFEVLEDLELPGALQGLCTSVTEAEFRNDASSTVIRKSGRSDF